jgi:hypothetical protein
MYMGQLDQIRSRTAPSENPAIPPGIMLEAGVYPVTWGLLALEKQPGCGEERPQILAASKPCNGVDISTSMIMHYPASGQQVVLSMSMETKSASNFCRIEGTKGHIDVEGLVTSHPESFTIFHKSEDPSLESPLPSTRQVKSLSSTKRGGAFITKQMPLRWILRLAGRRMLLCHAVRRSESWKSSMKYDDRLA